MILNNDETKEKVDQQINGKSYEFENVIVIMIHMHTHLFQYHFLLVHSSFFDDIKTERLMAMAVDSEYKSNAYTINDMEHLPSN